LINPEKTLVCEEIVRKMKIYLPNPDCKKILTFRQMPFTLERLNDGAFVAGFVSEITDSKQS
jgi:hypothetical protein